MTALDFVRLETGLELAINRDARSLELLENGWIRVELLDDRPPTLYPPSRVLLAVSAVHSNGEDVLPGDHGRW